MEVGIVDDKGNIRVDKELNSYYDFVFCTRTMSILETPLSSQCYTEVKLNTYLQGPSATMTSHCDISHSGVGRGNDKPSDETFDLVQLLRFRPSQSLGSLSSPVL
jgi:hypothetical protein